MMMGTSYYDSVWRTSIGEDFADVIKGLPSADVKMPTPEGLRAAAKVLEEKAKELDKPVLTHRQKKFISGDYDHLTQHYICTHESEGVESAWWCSNKDYLEGTQRSARECGWSKEYSDKTRLDGIPMYNKCGDLAIDFSRL